MRRLREDCTDVIHMLWHQKGVYCSYHECLDWLSWTNTLDLGPALTSLNGQCLHWLPIIQQYLNKQKNGLVQILRLRVNFTTLLANSADDKLVIFYLFFSENRLWHFMLIVSLETVCTKCQILFSWKNEIFFFFFFFFKMSSAENFTQSAKR